MKSIFIMLSLSVFLLSSASAQIVNLDAKSDGTSNPVNLSLAAGTYTVDPIGISAGGSFDAWNAWGKTTCNNLNGCIRDGNPTTVFGWLNIYGLDSANLTNVMIGGASATPSSGSNYYVGTYDAYPDAASALAHALSAQFTIATASVVSFYLPDDKLIDNQGGISLDLNMVTAQSVPEPESIALIGLGLVGLAAIRRRRNKSA